MNNSSSSLSASFSSLKPSKNGSSKKPIKRKKKSLLTTQSSSNSSTAGSSHDSGSISSMESGKKKKTSSGMKGKVKKTKSKASMEKDTTTTKSSTTTGGSPALLRRKKPKSTSGRFNGNKSLGDMSIMSTGSGGSSTSKIRSAPIRPLGPVVYDNLPDPRDLMKQITQEVKDLKHEARNQFQVMEESKKDNDEAVKRAKQDHKRLQIEKLKGNELMKVEQMLRMGFDEEIVRDHLEKGNRTLEKEMTQAQEERLNLETNIKKMIDMNKKSEKAVTAAAGAFGPLVVRQQALQAKLEQVELELYTIEARAKHRRNMRSVEMCGKDKYKAAMKTVVRKMEQRCTDSDLVRDILKIAGKALSSELGIEDHDSDYSGSDDDDDSDDDSDDSSYDVYGQNNRNANKNSSSGDDDSVSVSSVRSDDEEEYVDSDEDDDSD